MEGENNRQRQSSQTNLGMGALLYSKGHATMRGDVITIILHLKSSKHRADLRKQLLSKVFRTHEK